MAVVGDPEDRVTLKIVYCGPPAAGKTTNLQQISGLIYGNELGRLTARQVGENRLASLEIPMAAPCGPMGRSVVVRLETMQGDVSGAGTWSLALAEADGIVFVADSSPNARTANVKALAGLRDRLEGRDRSATAIPVVMQWNKRDLAVARPIGELETELNHRCFPSIEAASLRGTGVVETLMAIVKRTIAAVRKRAGVSAMAEAELEQTVMATIERLSQTARAASAERFGETIELQSATWQEVREPERPYGGGNRLWPREAVFSAESIGGESSAARMLQALERASTSLNDQGLSSVPAGLMAGLLAGCERAEGSLLLFRQKTARMEECEVVPAGGDPLNALPSTTGGSKATILCSGRDPLFVGDLEAELSRDGFVPGTEHLRAALIVPLLFGTHAFGGMVVYVRNSEPGPTAAEHAYWRTAANLTGVFLAWRSAQNRAAVSRRTGAAAGSDVSERLDV